MSTLAGKMKSMNSWRTQYNPLRGLTIQRAVSLLEQGMRGDLADLQWTYEFIEQTDADLLALVERRTSALCEMDWNIKTVAEEFAGYNKKLAQDQTDELRAAYDRIDNLYEALEHLEMAAFRGFSIVQPHPDKAGNIIHLECLDHWNFVRDGRYGPWGWNPEAKSVSFSSIAAENILDAQEFIIREVRRPVDRIALIKFVRANLSEKDWDAYIEIYGIPAVFIILPKDIPDDKKTEYRDAAEAAAEGRGGSLPNGSDVKTLNEVRGVQPFDARLKYLSEKLVLAGTGGLLTMLTEAGSGTLAGGAHSDTFKTIARKEARVISELFQRKIDQKILDEKFPGKPRLAYFAIAAEEEQDIGDIVTHFQGLAQAGLQVDPEDASERTGYKLTLRPAGENPPAINRDRGAKILAMNRETVSEAVAEKVNKRLETFAIDQLAEAMGEDFAPVRNRIAEALAIEDDQQMLEALSKVREDIPGLLLQMCRDPKAQKVLEETITAGFFNGLAEGVAKHGMKVDK